MPVVSVVIEEHPEEEDNTCSGPDSSDCLFIGSPGLKARDGERDYE
jgi:hypothetical protein